MPYHIKLKEYNCPNCDVLYIPYKVNMPCPNCKKIPENTSEEYLCFIDELIVSLRINKMQNESYLPSAWYIGSFTDYIQDIIFNIFYSLSKNKPKDIDNYINEYLDSIKWDEVATYRKNHVHDIFYEIYPRRKELCVSIWTKFLFKLLP